jgi:hypothetical protein
MDTDNSGSTRILDLGFAILDRAQVGGNAEESDTLPHPWFPQLTDPRNLRNFAA